MKRPMLATFLALGLFLAPSVASGQQTTDRFPPRTFPEYAGTWLPDGARRNATDVPGPPMPRPGVPVGGVEASPVPPPEPKLVITTSPTQITLATIPRAPHGTDVFRFDGLPTNVGDGQGTLTLVAGAIVLTAKSARMLPGNYEMTLTTTDMLSVSGDALTIERQYTRSVRLMDGDKVGYIRLPSNEDGPADTRVKMVYRRQAPPAQ